MESQIINIETAKLAKEKGFDLPTVCCYNNHHSKRGEKLTYRFNIKFTVPSSNRSQKIKYKSNSDLAKWHLSAPTRSLLQKWLREKHQFHIEIIPDKNDPINKWHSVNYYLKCMKEPDNIGIFNTYEKALEAGLKQGLNGIRFPVCVGFRNDK